VSAGPDLRGGGANWAVAQEPPQLRGLHKKNSKNALQQLSLVKYLVCKFYFYNVYTILDLRCLIIYLIHYKMYISTLSSNLDVEIYKFILHSDLYILQSLKLNIDILSYYYNCKYMKIIAFEGG